MKGDSLPGEIRDRIEGMAKRGETVRAIAATLTEEGFHVHYSTVSRVLAQSSSAPMPPRPSPPSRRAPAPSRAEDAPPAEPPEPEPPIVVPEDPRELARLDWIYYEELKIKLRRRAERELEANNIKGYELLLRQARAAEERAAELRPPVPPDPMKDPAYLEATRVLVEYLQNLIERAEQGLPQGARTLPRQEPRAA